MLRTVSALVVASLLAVACLWSSFAMAQDEATRVEDEIASAHVQSLANNALGILRQDDVALEIREATFRDLMRDSFNLEAIGNLVLARNKRGVAPHELEEYHSLFSEFVLARYSLLMGGYAGEDFVIINTQDSGSRDVMVISRIDRPGGDAINAAWRVRAYNGAPKIIDVQVENISMVISQREEFDAVIQRGGFEALLESLRAQTEMLPVEAPS